MAKQLYGALARFETSAALYHACEHVRDAGYMKWDAHTPFPVHGLENAMGLKRSKVPWVSLVFGLCLGTVPAFLGQAWVSNWGSQQVISGKPMIPWQAFVPVTFEVSVLMAAIGALLGMLALNGLPRLHHALFASKAFEAVTDDKFFISIEAQDPKFDATATSEFLDGLGATLVELIEE
jgi:hypothetical protein